jgi:TetR/AcrR family transcriptional regulator, mexJK operon transcriptional repressor
MDASVATRSGRDERRAGIVEIARKAFLQDGYAGTSMSSIAARLGGSKATLYNYFPSKKDLFFAVTEMETSKLIALVFEVEDAGGDFRRSLHDLCRRFLTALLSDDMVASYRLIVAESARFPEIGRATFEFGMKRGLERVAAYFQKAMDQGGLRAANTLVAAQSFFDLETGHLHKLRLWNVAEHFSAEAIEEEVERIVSTFLAVYGNDELSRAARQYTG